MFDWLSPIVYINMYDAFYESVISLLHSVASVQQYQLFAPLL